jgi:hypothetical protein
MKRDIDFSDIHDLVIAIAKDFDTLGNPEWNVYLINFHQTAIQNVLVSSDGYGKINGEERQTTTLRHFFQEVPALDYVKVEPIMEEVFGLHNRYWVSFYIDGKVFDKRYVFEPNVMLESELDMIPFVNREGVFLR